MAVHCRICSHAIILDQGMPKASSLCADCRSITIPCRCGCGGEAHLYGYDGKQRQGYMPHHYSRTDKHKNAWKENKPSRPMAGKKHSSETKNEMSGSRRGASNSNWKGGLTEQMRGIRRSPEYYRWRKDVLSRDNHTCRLCGLKKNLHVHHKQPVVECPDKIFEVSNGLTLCRKCHEETHLITKE